MRKIINQDEWLRVIESKRVHQQSSAVLSYSSYWDAYVDDPKLMQIPIEDHLVHRGDGVFEAFKVTNAKIYLLAEHLNRLEQSSEALGLSWPMARSEVENILNEMIHLKNLKFGAIRIFLSRGAGGFSANPYDSKQTQFHFILLNSKMPAAEKYQLGATLGKSQIQPKSSFWAKIKSCNYLPNVLMKKEAVDRGLDFTIGFDEQGHITESSTENVVVLDKNNYLCRPKLDHILKGTTMIKVFQLAEQLINSNQTVGNKETEIAGIRERDLNHDDLISAKEIMVVGTTWDVLPITRYEGKPIGNGNVGPVAKKLLNLLQQDQA